MNIRAIQVHSQCLGLGNSATSTPKSQSLLLVDYFTLLVKLRVPTMRECIQAQFEQKKYWLTNNI